MAPKTESGCNAQPVIEVEDLWRVYQLGGHEVQALKGISLEIQRAEFMAIMGRSGSGKSTLMNLLGCLDSPSYGRYFLDGLDVGSIDEDGLSDLRNQKIGFVFQGFNLIPRTTALANVELPLAYGGVGREERRARSIEALESVGMGDRTDHLPTELSGGQQQRVAIARAIVTEPSLILADEPTGNLDASSTEDVLRIFEDLNGEGRTVVIITHEDEVAERVRRVMRIDDGEIASDRLNPVMDATG